MLGLESDLVRRRYSSKEDEHLLLQFHESSSSLNDFSRSNKLLQPIFNDSINTDFLKLQNDEN